MSMLNVMSETKAAVFHWVWAPFCGICKQNVFLIEVIQTLPTSISVRC